MSSKSISYHYLVESFQRPGCAICNLVLHDVDRFLDGLLYENALDIEVQRSFRGRRGLCDEHSWQLLKYKGQSLSIGILYRAALDELLSIFEESPGENEDRSGVVGWLNDREVRSHLAQQLVSVEPCIVCTTLQKSEKLYLDTLSQHLSDTRLKQAFEASDGLCLPHFRMALGNNADVSVRNQLICSQKLVWTRMKKDLDEFVAKSDYLHRDQITESEGSSWRRAVRIAGERGVFGPDPRKNNHR